MTDLQAAVAELQRAMNFYDAVIAAPAAERLAVGHDHTDWVFDCCRKIVAAAQVQDALTS